MTVNLAINGFGRIGRHILRAFLDRPIKNLNIVAINTTDNIQSIPYLLKYDSIHGTLNEKVMCQDNALLVKDKKIALSFEMNPENIPWKYHQVDIVLECTGRFTTKDSAQKHIQAGAKKVLISAPGNNIDATIIYGVNHHTLKPEHQIVSNASCTTNCLAPIVKILHDSLGIIDGFVTTIHAYTNDQNLQDSTHKDLRRTRAANLSMIPTSTGAAKSIGLIIPELIGKLDGVAVRVPIPNVSLIDFKVNLEQDATVHEINRLFQIASTGSMKNILAINTLPLVSSDFCHTPFSCIIDFDQTYVINKRSARIAAWYDNEWGFAHRMLDVAAAMSHNII